MEVDIPSEYAIFARDELRNTSTKNVFSFLLIYPSLMAALPFGFAFPISKDK